MSLNLAQQGNNSRLFTWQHYAVIATGLVVFVLLFFAQKTNLNNPSVDKTVEGSGQGSSSEIRKPEDVLPKLKPIGQIAGVAELQAKLQSDLPQDSLAKTLRRLAGLLGGNQRFDAGAIYAGKLAEAAPTVRNLLVAGAMYRGGLQYPEVAGDTVIYSYYSNQSIGFLESALKAEPENTEVLMELGFAFVEARDPQKSMMGIQQFKKVLDIDPDNVEASFFLGRFALQVAKFERAVELFTKVVEADPERSDAKSELLVAQWGLAKQYMENGNVEAAKPLLEMLSKQEIDPQIAQSAAGLLKK